MTQTESFQIPIEAAELYESAFVPASSPSGRRSSASAAGVSPGQSVLDVACGTGIVARTAADLVGADGSVVGVDLNEAMLTVARRVRPDIDWRQGDAAALPFADGSFDVVLCQMALMFFADRHRALQRDGAGRGRRAAPSPCSCRARSTSSRRSSRSSSWRRASPVPRRRPCSAPTSCAATSTSSPRSSPRPDSR